MIRGIKVPSSTLHRHGFVIARHLELRYTAIPHLKSAVANVAQLVEQRTRNAQVTGSSPVVGSTS